MNSRKLVSGKLTFHSFKIETRKNRSGLRCEIDLDVILKSFYIPDVVEKDLDLLIFCVYEKEFLFRLAWFIFLQKLKLRMCTIHGLQKPFKRNRFYQVVDHVQ